MVQPRSVRPLYASAIPLGDLLWISGQLPIDADGRGLLGASAEIEMAVRC